MKLIVGVAIEIEDSLSINSATVLFDEILRKRTDVTFLRVSSLEALQADGTVYDTRNEEEG